MVRDLKRFRSGGKRHGKGEMADLDDHLRMPSCQWPAFFNASATSGGM